MHNFDDVLIAVRVEIENMAGSPISDYNQEIFGSGYLDSLNILHIITFLEAKFSIEIDPFSVNLDTLGSLNKIAKYVQERQRM